MNSDSSFWFSCIQAFLHDPPDKALDIQHHEDRACRYLSAALDTPVDQARGDWQKRGDWLASALERLPLPIGTLKGPDGQPLSDHEQPFNRLRRDQLERVSSISGVARSDAEFRSAQDLSPNIVDQRIEKVRSLAIANPEARLRALALWRFLPEALPHACELPGDSRLRDHTIVDHCDASVAASVAMADGAADLVVFSISPVQDYIGQARSLRDLWTGSYLIAWLTIRAMLPIIERFGPWCILSPGLRGAPFLDHWLGEQGLHHADGTLLKPDSQALRSAGIPNTFTALIPRGHSAELREAVQASVQAEWLAIGKKVRKALNHWDSLSAGQSWSMGWEEQCAEVWDTRAEVFPLVQANSANEIRQSAETIKKIYGELLGAVPNSVTDAETLAKLLKSAKELPAYASPDQQGFWQLGNELAQKLLEASKRIRRISAHAPTDDHREKCSIMPSYAVMGPHNDTATNKEWWEQAILNPPALPGRLRVGERLSAPGLIKRFAFGAYFKDILGKDEFPDTREAACRWWVNQLNKTNPAAWNRWDQSVRELKMRAQDTLDQTWTVHELLDESMLAPGRLTGLDLGACSKLRQQFGTLLSAAKKERLPAPPRYYAILVADGDNMGEYLRGQRGPTLEAAYHPEMVKHFRELAQRQQCVKSVDDALKSIRPGGPASQFSFSRALGEFTVKAAEDLYNIYHGAVVYAGGDDVLAVLPVATALSAAAGIASLFNAELDGATLSAGLAIVHVQDDLRSAIAEARSAEACAKRSGRGGLAVRVVRRSGECTEAFSPWECVVSGVEGELDWQGLSSGLANTSDRWVHHLLDELESLAPWAAEGEAFSSRVAHLIEHSDDGQQFKASEVQQLWQNYATSCRQRNWTSEAIARNFAIFCQNSAWIARFMEKRQ